MRGTDTSSVELWLSASLSEAPLPLYSGVVLPFVRNNVNENTPLRFYYEPVENGNIVLLLNSLGYD